MSSEPTQVVQVRQWVAGELHVDHESFAMSKGFAKAVIDYIDAATVGPDKQTWTVYSRTDGDLIAGEYAYTDGLEWFEDDDKPTELFERKYVLIEERRIVVPKAGNCTFDVDDDYCGNEDTEWVQAKFEVGDLGITEWVPRCPQHKEAS